ncbi:unnamed protein product [Peronospora destructor]|uniref:SET domain-containing protein n=1 Tax=Peronospora destructor TaxID=86335 RepID=A0AAV0VD46_9STRA|nr:unnamed protein product [Peronospora destructor]
MEEYFQLYEKSADSYRSLFCRRCFVYDCDYHGCREQPKLRILEQNAVALNMQEKERMINTGRNSRGVSAIFGWNKRTSIVCARSYLVCSGNFCEMAKMIGDKTCTEVAEMCAYYNINDCSLPKEARPQPKCRRSRKKKNWRMSIAHFQNSRNGMVNSVQIKIEPCSHLGPCEPGRECDIDLCKLCSADEIVVREKDGPYHSHSDDTTKDGRSETTCQNRSIALGRQKHVRMGRSNLGAAGWGLFVDDLVAKDEFIIEYIGEMVSQEEADRRGAVYDKVNRSYLFNLDTKTVIDSTRKGNKTRYINHSSKSPNCACKIMNVNSDFRIGLYATHDIQPHTELFFDYGYDKELYHAELLKQPTVTEWMKK